MSGAVRDAAEAEIVARAAWLHYAGGLTQSAVAERLGLAPTRAHRLIASAAREGLVRVFVDCEVAGCIALEDALRERHGLAHCTVVPDIGDDPALPLRALGQGGGRYLLGVLESEAHVTIGIGHGRTLAAAVDALPRRAIGGRTWVSLLGGLTRKFSANPYDVIFRLAEKVGGEAYFMPAPMFADGAEDRETMLGQSALGEVMRRIDDATLCLLGIGATDPAETLALGGGERDAAARAELAALGAVAELLGQFIDVRGRTVATPWDGRAMAPSLESLVGREIVAVAGGTHKRAAIAAVLASGLLTGLITDESSARALVTDAAGAGGGIG